MRIFSFLLLGLLTVISFPVHAEELELGLSGYYDEETDTTNPRVEAALVSDHFFLEGAVRFQQDNEQDMGMDIGAGVRQDFGTLGVHAGGLILIQHTGTHTFSEPFGKRTSTDPALGALIGVSLDLGNLRPYARAQRLSVQHSFADKVQAGTDENGDPVFDKVHSSRTDWWTEYVLGIRYQF